MYRIGIDLGGTNIVAGVVDENYKIVGKGKMKTNMPRPAEAIADDMAKAVFMAIKDAGLTIDDIDGYVVCYATEELQIGDVVKVKILDASINSLSGQVIFE